ncbi:TPA: divalent metal cation transporter, partial [Neisseria meningitidis]
RLVKGDEKHKLTSGMNALALAGLIYLTGFTVLFLLNLAGMFK